MILLVALLSMLFFLKEPYVARPFNGFALLFNGCLDHQNMSAISSFVFTYFIHPVLMIILSYYILTLLKTAFLDCYSAGNEDIRSAANKLLGFAIATAVVAWAFTEAATGFSGTDNFFVRFYEITKEYRGFLMAAFIVRFSCSFPKETDSARKKKKEKVKRLGDST